MVDFKLCSDYYTKLSEDFYYRINPEPAVKGDLVLFNDKLAKNLGMDLNIKNNIGIFTGDFIDPSWNPIAEAYSGHQFGYYTRLGDGRAVLLGEWKDKDSNLWDIQLKGSGKTPYSRSGDGLATLASMLREYIISFAMQSLNIRSSGSLALATNGKEVFRQKIEKGAVLTRTISSHIRIGTFEYAFEIGGKYMLKEIADYSISRHYPSLKDDENKYLLFIENVIDRQAKLISLWMSKGFIHGVMNTDNMTISGEGIDYGPCAFMDYFNFDEVFSSIDSMGRYRYKNQPMIAQWNLARFAELFIDLIPGDDSITELTKIVKNFMKIYKKYYLREMAAKIGIEYIDNDDINLIDELLNIMNENSLDFTNLFYNFTNYDFDEILKNDERFNKFINLWENRIKKENKTKDEIILLMKSNNPVIIPRNHMVETAIYEAVENNNIKFTKDFLKYLNSPYNYSTEIPNKFKEAMDIEMKKGYKTYCGT
ncbi:MAG: YdiU family protein [Tissierellia bacterium]|nr:YdiU family protein [Tissierellia bacterium]